VSVEANFIDEIQHDPLSEYARLIYADWLDERGDVRASFLRLEIEYVKTNLTGKLALQWYSELEQLLPQIDFDWIKQVGHRYDFRILSWGTMKLDAVKRVKKMTSMPLMDAKRVVEEAPTTLIYSIPIFGVVEYRNSQWFEPILKGKPSAVVPEFVFQLSQPAEAVPADREWGSKHIQLAPNQLGYELGDRLADLILVSAGYDQSRTVALIQHLTNKTTADTMELINNCPCTILKNQTMAERKDVLSAIGYHRDYRYPNPVFEFRASEMQ
jgi:uncharacterized protein (TIGR02996 family)